MWGKQGPEEHRTRTLFTQLPDHLFLLLLTLLLYKFYFIYADDE